MSQYIINTGALPNDGTGDPLRIAFQETNLNFNQVFAAGPVGSNIAIANNTIQVTNTNGNLILATNGIGAIKPAADMVPDYGNVRMLGSPTLRFNTLYTQYLDLTTANLSGNLFVGGNLYVDGNTVTVGYSNLSIANTTITLAANAISPIQADGGGILLAGANANITYSDFDNNWNFNISVDVNGSVTANTFIGDGSQLSNVSAAVDAIDINGTTLSPNVIYSSLVEVGTLTDLSVAGNVVANTIQGTFIGDGGNLSNVAAGAVIGNVNNANFSTYAGTANTANIAAKAVYALDADRALVSVNSVLAGTANLAINANYANVANTALRATLANSAIVANVAIEALSVGTLANLSVTGNITVGNILTNGYYYANGVPFTGGGNANATPGGVDGQVQFNDNGVFGGDTGLTFNKALNILSVGNTVNTVTLNASGNVIGKQLTATNGMVLNSRTITEDYELNGFNAGSVGPITTAPGVIVDITDGNWVIS
jgi:hypothetical protein